MLRRPPRSTLFPYTTLFRSLLSGFNPAQLVESDAGRLLTALGRPVNADTLDQISPWRYTAAISADAAAAKEGKRSEEHTSELQSQSNLVCRLLLEKKKKKTK